MIGIAMLVMVVFGGCGEGEEPVFNLDYEDGEYVETVFYYTPEGSDQMTVYITLKNNEVKDFDLEPITKSKTSKQYQKLFLEQIEDVVVGQRIDEIYINVVNGSSLLADAFQSAIWNIRDDAKTA